MHAVETEDRAGLDPCAPRPVDGHPDYQWFEDDPFGEVFAVYWVPQVDAFVRIGAVHLNPGHTGTNHVPRFLVKDAAGEWLASGDTVPELVRLLVLHHRTEQLAAQHANAAADAFTAAGDLDDAGWELCVELADFPTWTNEFGPFGRPLSGSDGTPTIDTLLRGLGVDPDHEGRPDGHLRPSLELYYERAYEQAWHSALVQAARSRLRTP